MVKTVIWLDGSGWGNASLRFRVSLSVVGLAGALRRVSTQAQICPDVKSMGAVCYYGEDIRNEEMKCEGEMP